MVLFNLNVLAPAPEARRTPLGIGIAGMLFALVCAGLIPDSTPNELRPLTIEERETAVVALTRLADNVGSLTETATDLIDQFSSSESDSFVDPSTSFRSLVRLEDEVFFFAPRFFLSDSYSQEVALAASLNVAYPVDKLAPPESIARRED